MQSDQLELNSTMIRCAMGKIEKVCGYEYVLHKIEGKKTPLMLLLHSAGERGHKFFLSSNHKNYLPDKYQSAYNLLIPLCDDHKIWEPDNLKVLIDIVLHENKDIDSNRVYVMGWSMGGRGTWDFATAYPDIPAAIVPICGYSCYLKAKSIAKIPTWAIHGSNDMCVPVNETKKMIFKMREFNGNPKMSIIKGAGHEIFMDVMESIDLHNWIISQKKE